jgi:hypothetical protein
LVQRVAGSAYGPDHYCRSDLGPELGDVHVGCPVARALVARRGEQLPPRKDAARVIHHDGKDGGLGRGQRDVMTSHGRWRLGRWRLGQDFADHGDQLAGAERPGEPPAGAGAASLCQAARPGARREEDDRRAQGAADAPGIQAWHGEIEHGGRVRAAGQLGDHLPGVGDQVHAQTVPAQVASRHLGHLGLVLGQEHRLSLVFGHRSASDRSGPGRG